MESRSDMQNTRIQLCGRMNVEIEGRRIVPDRAKGWPLLAYLITHRHRSVRRDELTQAIWGDDLVHTGLLTAEVSHLRRQLGEHVLPSRTRDIALRLADDATIDREEIERREGESRDALSAGDATRALRLASEALGLLKRGTLLSELEADWIDERRRALDDISVSLRRAFIKASLQVGGDEVLEPAERMAHELVAMPHDIERNHLLLMKVLVARGDRAEAIRVFDRLRRQLREELDVVPGPEIRELNARLLRETAPPPDRPPLPRLLESMRDGPFVGRDEVMRRVRSRWENVAQNARVVVLTGPAGIGKTRLAARFGDEAHEVGGTVLYGCCDEEPLTPYQPLVEAIDHYAGVYDLRRELPGAAEELARLPGLRSRLRPDDFPKRAPPPDDRSLFEAVLAVLRHAAEARPLLLVVDDVQWADAGTFQWLRYAGRAALPPKCMLLLASRDRASSAAAPWSGPEESFDELLIGLRRHADVEHIRLTGLGEEETANLIQDRSGAPASEGFARDLTHLTHGNPFFIREALTDLDERNELHRGAEPDLGELGVPSVVDLMISRRLEALSEPSRRVLARASVIGPEFDLALLADVMKLTPDDALDEVEELIDRGLLVEVRGDHFAFSHALIRKTEYRSLTDTRRARLHRAIALALERRAKDLPAGAQPVPPASLAYHFEQGHPGDPERAAYYWVQTGDQAAQGAAYRDAVGHYDRALAALGPDGADRLRIGALLGKGRAQLRTGQPEEARARFTEAAGIARRTGAAEQLGRAALGFHGRYISAGEVDDEGIALLEEALAALDPSASPLRTRVLARLANALHWEDLRRQDEVSEAAMEMAGELDNAPAMLEALDARHTALLHADHLAARMELAETRLELAEEVRSGEGRAAALRAYIHDLCERGDILPARQRHRELAQLAEELHQPLYTSFARHWDCVFAQVDGHFEAAEGLALEAFELATKAGAGDARKSLLDKRFSIYREQRRLPELRPAIEQLADTDTKIKGWCAVLALLDAETGNGDQALARLDELVAGDAAAIRRDSFWLYTLAVLAEVCARLGAAEQAAVVYRLLKPHEGTYVQVGMDTFWGSTFRFLGLAATARADWDAAEEAFQAAELRHMHVIESAPLLARTQLNHADMLLRRGDAAGRAKAARLLDEARGTANPLGMVDLGRRADEIQARSPHSAVPV